MFCQAVSLPDFRGAQLVLLLVFVSLPFDPDYEQYGVVLFVAASHVGHNPTWRDRKQGRVRLAGIAGRARAWCVAR